MDTSTETESASKDSEQTQHHGVAAPPARARGNAVVVFDEEGQAISSVDYWSAQSLVQEDSVL